MVTDFHSHILPRMDDGSKHIEMSLKMIDMMQDQGVDRVIATPHFYAAEQKVGAFLERRTRRMEELQGHLPQGAPQILAGAEVYYFDGMSKAADVDRLTIEGTNLLLLEMPFAQWDKSVLTEVERLIRDRRFQIILAHVERYAGFQKNKDIWNEVLSLPVICQLNAEAFESFFSLRFCKRMVQDGHRILLGSDAHRVEKREPNLGKGRSILERKLGKSVLEEIDRLGDQLLLSAQELGPEDIRLH